MFRIFPFISNVNNGNVFNRLFNDEFIGNIIGQVMNSDVISDLTKELYNEESYDIEFNDYGEYYLIKGYLPGLNPKDIRIDFEENKAILTIKNKKVYSRTSRNSAITVVQSGGNIIKAFYVEEVDTNNLGASFKDDLLIITIPKARKNLEENNAKLIEVDNFKVE